MRMLTMFCLWGLTIAQAASADELIFVPPVTGAGLMMALGINDSNVITGYYFDSAGKEHGFVGTIDGQYTSFDSNDGSEIVPLAIDNNGEISGYTTTSVQAPCASIPFLRSPGGNITTVMKGKKTMIGLAAGFGRGGEFVGSYCDKNGTALGYIGRNGKYKSTLTLGDEPMVTLAYAINKDMDIAGAELNQFGENGFLLLGGVFQQIFYPNSTFTMLTGLNDNGLAAGTARTQPQGTLSFVLDTKTGDFKTIPISGFSSGSINSKGFVVLTDSVNNLVYCPLSKRRCDAVKQAH